MLKRLSFVLVVGVLALASTPVASAEDRCGGIRAALSEVTSNQETSMPYILGKGTYSVTNKLGTNLKPAARFQVNPGGDSTLSVALHWDWTDHVKRVSNLKDQYISNRCGDPSLGSKFEATAVYDYDRGVSAQEFLNNRVSVTLQPKLYKSHRSVPSYIRYSNGSVYITPLDPGEVVDEVYNLHFKTRLGNSNGPDFVWPIRVIQTPSDSSLPTEVEDLTKEPDKKKNLSSDFGGFFSFSS